MNCYHCWVYDKNKGKDIFIEKYYATSANDAIALAKQDHGYLDCKWEAYLEEPKKDKETQSS